MLAAALAIAAAGGACPASAAESDAEGQVRVLLASGRQFTAEVDRRTDAATLWLRWGQGTAVILRPIAWGRVVRMEIAGQTFSGEIVRRAVILVRRELPLAVNPPPPPRPEPPAPEPTGSLPGGTGWQAASGAREPPVLHRPIAAAASSAAAPRRVRALEVEAGVGKWGPGVEADGLVVEISPLDEQGAIVPVRGTVEVELIGQGQAPNASSGFPTLGHWVQSVWPEDFAYRGARCRLPFQAVQPEFDLHWEAKGMVHVRLSLPGEGVFEATAAMTRIRPFSEVRDNYQEATGGRFLPNERTSQSPGH